MSRDFKTLTLHHLQTTQPWTLPYSPKLVATVEADDGLGHLLATHTMLHAQKTLGQIAAIFEELDHTGADMDMAQRDTLAGKAADLVTVAMRFANLYNFDLARAVVLRSEDKNNVTIPAWPTYQGANKEPGNV